MGAESLSHGLPWYFSLTIGLVWGLTVLGLIAIQYRRRRRRREAPQLGRSNSRLKGLPPGRPSTEVVRPRRFSRR
jgi:hypothetical protein